MNSALTFTTVEEESKYSPRCIFNPMKQTIDAVISDLEWSPIKQDHLPENFDSVIQTMLGDGYVVFKHNHSFGRQERDNYISIESKERNFLHFDNLFCWTGSALEDVSSIPSERRYDTYFEMAGDYDAIEMDELFIEASKSYGR